MEEAVYTYTTKDKKDMLFCIHGLDCYLALWNLSQWLRNAIKYPPEDTHNEYIKGLEEARVQLLLAMEDQGVNFEMFE